MRCLGALFSIFPFFIILNTSIRAQTVLNLNIESVTSMNTPRYWQSYSLCESPVVNSMSGGERSICLSCASSPPSFLPSSVQNHLPVEVARGKTFRFSGKVKTTQVQDGHAGLFVHVETERNLIVDNMEEDGPSGTIPWTEYTTEVEIPIDAQSVSFGLLLTGEGTAQFKDLHVELDGTPYPRRAPVPPVPNPSEVEWLRSEVLPLETTDPTLSLSDLQPLAQMIGNARIVGLGEATHGTREFFRLKHRLVRLLGSRDAHTVFALESSMADARAINQYLQDGTGRPDTLIEDLGDWTWNTESFLTLIEWMRRYNVSEPGSISFWGFDVRSYETAMTEVRRFIQETDPTFVDTVDQIYDSLREADDRIEIHASGRVTPQPLVQDWVEQAGRIVSHLEANRQHYQAQYNDTRVSWAIQYARLVQQYALSFLSYGPSRDRLMAKNIAWILAHSAPEARILLWAHNDHVSRDSGSMGHYLAKRYSRQYRSVGLAFHHGSYRANGYRGQAVYPAHPPPVGSLEDFLHRADRSLFALDLSAVSESSIVNKWIDSPVEQRSVGSFAAHWAFRRRVLAYQFDLLLYVEESNPSHPLP